MLRDTQKKNINHSTLIFTLQGFSLKHHFFPFGKIPLIKYYNTIRYNQYTIQKIPFKRNGILSCGSKFIFTTTLYVTNTQCFTTYQVVIDTTKVRLFKQITTYHLSYILVTMGIAINTTKMVFLDEKDYLQGFL